MSGRGYFGIGVYRPKHEENVGGLWRSAHLYGASFIFTIGHRYTRHPSDTSDAAKHVPLLKFDCFEDFMDFQHRLTGVPNGPRLIAIEKAREGYQPGPLPWMSHPEHAIYLLGAEDDGLPEEIWGRCHASWEIPTHHGWSLNVATAGSIVLYDRHLKQERKSLA